MKDEGLETGIGGEPMKFGLARDKD